MAATESYDDFLKLFGGAVSDGLLAKQMQKRQEGVAVVETARGDKKSQRRRLAAEARARTRVSQQAEGDGGVMGITKMLELRAILSGSTTTSARTSASITTATITQASAAKVALGDDVEELTLPPELDGDMFPDTPEFQQQVGSDEQIIHMLSQCTNTNMCTHSC
eukprot:m.190296 g.190296  ORF g.190296 m.190296 type:complete len:165 (+) comp14813_c0_seq1:284-778(+)